MTTRIRIENCIDNKKNIALVIGNVNEPKPETGKILKPGEIFETRIWQDIAVGITEVTDEILEELGEINGSTIQNGSE